MRIPTMRTNIVRDRHSERGVAMFIAIFTLLLITAIAAGMILASNSDVNISANFRDEQTAFFGAKGGIEEVRDRFRSGATNTLNGSLVNLNTNLPGSSNGILYVLNPNGGEVDTPWVTNGAASVYPDDEICTEITKMGSVCSGNPPVPAGAPWYTTTTASAAYATAPVMAWKWTRIMAKTNNSASGPSTTSAVDGNGSNPNYRACWTGTTQTVTSLASCAAAGLQPVYQLTTLAVTPSGSRRMVQAEVTVDLPTFPGALTFDGPNPSFNPPNSNAFAVTGNDQRLGPNNGVGCPVAANQAALGGYDAASTTTLAGDVSNRPNSYTGTGGTPSVGNVNSQLGPLATVTGLQQLVAQVESAAAPANFYSGNASSLTNVGTNAAPVINVVKGDLTLGGGFSGSGILLVEGTLTMSGNPDYNGIILVIGKGTVVKNGGGNGTLDGALFVANLYDASGHLIPSGPPGIPSVTWNGGGNANINYDSCWASSMNLALPYRIVAMREMMY